jgi:hypothetical protein
MGSVLLVRGEAGDLVVDLSHLKQPEEEVGPLQLLHDHGRGQTSLYNEVDLVALAEAAGAEGLLVFDAARAIFRTEQPDKNEVEKTRRRLDRLADQGQLEKDDSQKPKPARYSPVWTTRVISVITCVIESRQSGKRPVLAQPSNHAAVKCSSRPPSLEGVGCGRD